MREWLSQIRKVDSNYLFWGSRTQWLYFALSNLAIENSDITWALVFDIKHFWFLSRMEILWLVWIYFHPVWRTLRGILHPVNSYPVSHLAATLAEYIVQIHKLYSSWWIIKQPAGSLTLAGCFPFPVGTSGVWGKLSHFLVEITNCQMWCVL